MKEEFFIKRINSKHIGDDGAFIDGKVYASDSFFEDIHFKREWFELDEISYKASLVNLSDLIVMNAKPKYALIDIGFPKSLSLHEIKLLASGFNKAAKEFGYEIIGGDTIKNEKIAISMTFIGESKRPVFRKAKLNEFVAFTGDLGSVDRDLKTLLRGGKIPKTSKFITPKLRDEFFYKASKYITSACDISDGLFKELERISKISNVGYEFLKKIPKNMGCSGEEYEILFTFPKRNLSIISNLAKLTKTKITVFAVTKRGKYKNICKENHF
ncbi:thiamine-phosphate kinase [Caminibacter pacificus]|jgi:thiamine-monophosphate kinase